MTDPTQTERERARDWLIKERGSATVQVFGLTVPNYTLDLAKMLSDYAASEQARLVRENAELAKKLADVQKHREEVLKELRRRDEAVRAGERYYNTEPGLR